MNLKVKLILFVCGVAIGSFLLATYVESAKLADFIVQQQERIEDDSHSVILATAIANRMDGSDAFLLKEPVVNQNVVTDTLTASLQFYALAMFHDSSQVNALAIMVNHLTITDEFALLDDQNNHLLYVDIGFNQSIRLGSQDVAHTKETFITLYSNEQKLIIIELDTLIQNYPTLAFVAMDFSYGTLNNVPTYFYTLTEEQIQSIVLSSFFIYSQFETTYWLDPRIAYDVTLLPSLRALNSYYISHFSVYILFVGVLTYVFFFKKKQSKI